ncbi:MAG: serine acetyltransferase [Bacteroidales bacterium]|nr:serine acetyltransferase [Bacteroidales bacterium]
MDRVIAADLYRYGGLTGTRGLLKGLSFPGFRYTFLFRKIPKYRRRSIRKILLYWLLKRYEFKYGYQIPLSTEIGEGFYIGHFGPIVINEKARIGKNFTITHCVTIGQANRGKLKGYPTFGDNVWLGTGVVVVGNIQIGSDVLIAPNSFVNFDVPDHSLVVGNPAKIINQENPTEGYIISVMP